MSDLTIRPASPSDAGALLDIYAYYVEKTAVTFEYELPSQEEFSGRIENTLKRYPYIVAEKDGSILGYAYAGPFIPRAAYDWCAELSIYLAPTARGQGIGRTLYGELERLLRDMGIVNLYACIATTDTEDEYLTNQSPRFHQRMGYTEVGRFLKCGYKFSRWYHMIWMEKIIGEHLEAQPPVSFSK